MAQDRPTRNPGWTWYGAAFVLAAVLESIAAWRIIRDHGGALLVILPVVALALVSSLLARRGEGG